MIYLVDAHAWIEYFLGSKKGEAAGNIIHNPDNRIITPSTSLAEIKCWALRERQNIKDILDVAKVNSEIVDVSTEDWLRAAQLRHHARERAKDFGLLDPVILVKQEIYGGIILTGDKHFKGMKDVEYLGD